MRAKVLVEFKDSETGELRELNKDYTFSKERFEYINNKAKEFNFNAFLEEIKEEVEETPKETKKTTQKATRNKGVNK